LALRTRTIAVTASAALLAAGCVLTLALDGFRTSGLVSRQAPTEMPGAQKSSQATETVAVKERPIARPPAKNPQATAAPLPSPEAPPAPLRGLDEVPLSPPSSPASSEEPKPNALDANAKGKEILPWDLVEPVLVPPPPPVGAKELAAPAPQSVQSAPGAALTQLPSTAAVSTWLKSKMTEVKGEERARPLFHVELWLEPPREFKRHLVAVTYDFSTPAINPQSQTSRDPTTGFRVAVGELACVDTITLNLSFDDGRTQAVAVDGCRDAEESSRPSSP
jgi:hypothetical protein